MQVIVPGTVNPTDLPNIADGLARMIVELGVDEIRDVFLRCTPTRDGRRVRVGRFEPAKSRQTSWDLQLERRNGEWAPAAGYYLYLAPRDYVPSWVETITGSEVPPRPVDIVGSEERSDNHQSTAGLWHETSSQRPEPLVVGEFNDGAASIRVQASSSNSWHLRAYHRDGAGELSPWAGVAERTVAASGFFDALRAMFSECVVHVDNSWMI